MVSSYGRSETGSLRGRQDVLTAHIYLTRAKKASMPKGWNLEFGAIEAGVLSSTNALLAWVMVLVNMVAGDFGAIGVVAGWVR